MGHDNGEMGIVDFKIPKMNQAYVRVTCLCSRTAQELTLKMPRKKLI